MPGNDENSGDFLQRTHRRSLAMALSSSRLQSTSQRSTPRSHTVSTRKNFSDQLRHSASAKSQPSASSSWQPYISGCLEASALHELQALREAFELVAQSDDKHLNPDEFVSAFRVAGFAEHILPTEELHRLFAKVDDQFHGRLHWYVKVFHFFLRFVWMRFISKNSFCFLDGCTFV